MHTLLSSDDCLSVQALQAIQLTDRPSMLSGDWQTTYAMRCFACVPSYTDANKCVQALLQHITSCLCMQEPLQCMGSCAGRLKVGCVTHIMTTYAAASRQWGRHQHWLPTRHGHALL